MRAITDAGNTIQSYNYLDQKDKQTLDAETSILQLCLVKKIWREKQRKLGHGDGLKQLHEENNQIHI